MKKKEVIESFCALSSVVADKVFGHSKASDCFCCENPFSETGEYFQFDEGVMAFIEKAVKEAIEKKQQGGVRQCKTRINHTLFNALC